MAGSSARNRDGNGDIGGIFNDKLEQAKEAISDAGDALKERADDAVTSTEKYVGKHPWHSLAIAGGIGLVLGILLSRR